MNKINSLKIMFYSILTLIVLLMIIFIVWTFIEEYQGKSFCSSNFPVKSPILTPHQDLITTHSFEGIEFGYIKCCRGYYDKDHLLKQECKIMEYKR